MVSWLLRRTSVLVAVFCSLAIPAGSGAARVLAEEAQGLPGVANGETDFERDVWPILASRCVECHGPDAQESSFRVDQRPNLLEGGDYGEPAVIPGKSDESPLIRIVAGLSTDLQMPPDGPRLSAEEIGKLRAWIDQGAKMPVRLNTPGHLETEHWSFQPVVRPPLPSPEDYGTTESQKHQNWGRNAIDAFVLQRLAREGLGPSEEADRAVLIRRLYLDVTGLLPAPASVEQFVADRSPLAYERLVDELLASPHYGERWARHWLDVVRFAESDGFETNHERPNAYRFRDYVVQAFNHDKPFNEFAFEQIAGDTVSQGVATGFLVGGAHDRVKSPDPVLTAMQRQDELADMVNTTGTALLGLTLGCARCHNHKFDPVLQKDFYSLQAVFAGVQHGQREIESPESQQRLEQAQEIADSLEQIELQLESFRLLAPLNAHQNEEKFPARIARFVRFRVLATNSHEPCLDELEIWSDEEQPRNVALASAGATATSSGDYPGNPKHKLAHINDGQYGNEHSWISDTPATGWVRIELAEPTRIGRIVWGRDRNQQYEDRLATEYAIEIAREPDQWQTVASHQMHLSSSPGGEADWIYRTQGLSKEDALRAAELYDQREQLQQQRKELLASPKAYAGQFVQPGETHRLYRGDPMAKRERVTPDALTVLQPMLGTLDQPWDTAEQERRAAFARWLTSPDNPLPLRVIVNRLWHYHFGRGIVSTPSDFGAMGATPTHPELLDWLSSELVTNRWSLKHIHRLILLSSTYRQASFPRPRAMAVDRNASLLWRFPPRRLEAEAIRDNILLISGALDRRMGGPGFLMFHPNANYSRNWVAKDQFGPAEFRRMIYATKLRMEQDAVFGAFDFPDAGQIAPRRPRSTTPLQALNLLNSDFVLDQSHRFAERVRREADPVVERQIQRAYQLALGRLPDETERLDARQLVTQHGLEALCRALLNTNEFLFLF